MVDGRRERGARMELTLRMGLIEFVGDEDGRGRGDVVVAVAVLTAVSILSALRTR